MPLTVKQMHPQFVAEIGGVDLSQPVDDAKYRRDLRRVTTQDMDSINDNPDVLAAVQAADQRTAEM